MNYRSHTNSFHLIDYDQSFYSQQDPEEKAEMIIPTGQSKQKKIEYLNRYSYAQHQPNVISKCECSQCVNHQPSKYVFAKLIEIR